MLLLTCKHAVAQVNMLLLTCKHVVAQVHAADCFTPKNVVQFKKLSYVVTICRVIFLQDLHVGQPIQYKIIVIIGMFVIFITKINEYKSVLWSLWTIYNFIC